MSQESLNSNNLWENEELTEAELDALAGGQLANPNFDPNTAFGGSSVLVPPQTDSLFTSFVGAPGSVDPVLVGSTPMNLSLAFP